MRLFGLSREAEPGNPDDKEQEGDYGGPYGYGHPAHKPDPAATYHFEPETMPLLPVGENKPKG